MNQLPPSQVAKRELLRLMSEGVQLKRISVVTGVDRSSLHKWLNDQAPRGISADSLDKVFAALNMTIVQHNKRGSRLERLGKRMRVKELAEPNVIVPTETISPIYTEDELYEEDEEGCPSSP